MKRKYKILIFLTVAVLLINTATFFFLVIREPSPTGLTISEKEIQEEENQCFNLSDGRVACKIGTFDIKGGEITPINFTYANKG